MSKVLIVEDDRGIVASLTEFLGAEGFEAVSVSGQNAALEALENNKFDIVLLDISLSDGNGFGDIETTQAYEERTTVVSTAFTCDTDTAEMNFALMKNQQFPQPLFSCEALQKRGHILL